MSYLGVDTSNYTTSLALVRDGQVVANLKKGVYVAEHQRGVRQSDALFCHVKNLPLLMEELGAVEDLEAVGYSAKPRDVEGSYMPCFLAGELLARSLGANRALPVYAFSHQAGHVRAALYSAGALHLKEETFLAFHVSGGTTELLLCEGEKITLVGGTKDLTAGQAIDRIGVMLGLSFPCGAQLEGLALGVKAPKVKVCVKDLTCNMSGVENQAKKMFDEGVSKEEIAAFTIEFVRKTLEKLTENAFARFGKMPVLYA
ncbi:MAG: hypothetical protein IJZ37_01260, partial [Clostridia bacterium]|nr:hypothetical protein [Clostridia bacterium]